MPVPQRRLEQVIFGSALMFGCGLCEYLVVYVLFMTFVLDTSRRVWEQCSPEHRTMAPIKVWLNLIPVFHLYWGCRTAMELGNSLRNEFRARGIDDGSRYATPIGLLLVAFTAHFYVFLKVWRNASNLCLAAAFITGVVYWVRIAGYGRRLRADDDYRLKTIALDDVPLFDRPDLPNSDQIKRSDSDFRP